MKILIADDQMQRYDRLISTLADIGVGRQQIDLVPCASNAREHLEKYNYDLLLLDILLPLWPEDSDFSSTHSLDLLFELKEEDDLNKPGHIVGITGDKSTIIEAGPSFTNSTWTVVEYSENNDGWIEQVKNCVNYILANENSTSLDKPDYGVDLAIICALEKPELEEVLRLDWNWSPPRPLDDMTFVSDGWFIENNRKITVVATAAQRMGMVSTALLSAAIISSMHPRLIAMCGICAGVKDKVKMGEVLFADPAWDFQSGKLIMDKEIAKLSVAPHQIPADQLVRNHVQQISKDMVALTKIYTDYGTDAIEVPKIHLGPVASGSVVLADGETIKEIKSQHRELIGVEMEIYGLYSAASVATLPKPKAFALKSVCDFADPNKKDNVQRYAAYTSARALQLLMETHGSRLLI